MYSRLCPTCRCEIRYEHKSSLDRAVRASSKCRRCPRKVVGPFVRMCPLCSGQIEYTSVRNMRTADRLGTHCRSCVYKDPVRRATISSKNSNPSDMTRKKKSMAQRKRRGTVINQGKIPSTGLLQTWGRKVKERDNYTCQLCGSDEDVHAHHVLSKSIYPDLALSVDNGQTLCLDCHWDVHGGGI